MQTAPKLIWTRMECALYRTPKTFRLLADEGGRSAFVTWVLSLGYSGENGLGGLIPHEALPAVHGNDEVAAILVKHNYWEPCPQGWIIHDWDEYNPGAILEEDYDSPEAKAKRSAHATKAANARWDRRRRDHARSMPNDADR